MESCRISEAKRLDIVDFTINVKMKPDVLEFVSFGDAEDRVYFLEQLTMHLRECDFDDTKD